MLILPIFYFRTKHLSDDWMLARNFVEPDLKLEQENKWAVYYIIEGLALSLLLI